MNVNKFNKLCIKKLKEQGYSYECGQWRIYINGDFGLSDFENEMNNSGGRPCGKNAITAVFNLAHSRMDVEIAKWISTSFKFKKEGDFGVRANHISGKISFLRSDDGWISGEYFVNTVCY